MLMLLCVASAQTTKQPAKAPAKTPAKTAAPAPAPQRTDQTALFIQAIRKPWTGDLDGMIERRYIRVATTYSKTHFFVDKGVQRGGVYEGFKLFEDELNLKLKNKHIRVGVIFLPMSREELLPAVMEGRADIAAAALFVTPERQKLVDFTDATMKDVNQIVVTGPQSPAIATVDDLAGQEVFVRKSSSYWENLERLNEQFKKDKKKPIVLKPAPETFEDEDVLEMLNAGLVKATVVDAHLAAFWKKIFTKLRLHPDVIVANNGNLAVAMRKNSPQLMAEANAWIKKHGPGTTFGRMMFQRYLATARYAKGATSKEEMARFQKMVDIFRKYGDKYDLDYVLMAAQGFQESGLRQEAKSPVGAIGVMQVMPATGTELKVGDITQTEANIHAGVKYIRLMINQYFKDEPIDDLNKGLFAFAAYNCGPGRLRSLRAEAEKRGLDRNRWFNNVERVAADKIGRETVQYVANIYKYYIAYTLAIEEMKQRREARSEAPSS